LANRGDPPGAIRSRCACAKHLVFSNRPSSQIRESAALQIERELSKDEILELLQRRPGAGSMAPLQAAYILRRPPNELTIA
jgi:hypothetical protein